ncbi:3-deoxy-7-phosphoheptulonate synthase [Armatimonas rosea]|uniref:Phospho-2-dehydro-3-deoxyheptonate aldolase n=1 Tax=Armatimonas rosea TaxID=685828 RepID=A0A7W9SU22_ARMRO|nr:3-deoxy-7-phosphoheptulonate synthase [Armatimonas rosea]MBB6052671.1 3-deoxy-7-phosphoheptulonate synthase [Armatimonas rosea]
MDKIADKRDESAVTRTVLPAPAVLREEFPVSAASYQTVAQGRVAIQRLLNRQDSRFLVVTGPCSIHDPEAALDYARRLAPLAAQYSDKLVILMRTYFEKPRTTVGWRGLINDPHLDGTYDMSEGLRRARKLLVEITELGLPVATELLDTATPDYFADLISFGSIGARTTESQPHRAMASGMPMPVGFKNGTDGELQIALDAMQSAQSKHSYLGFDEDGRCCVVRTPGNPDVCLVLRGGKKSQPNYDRVSVARAVACLDKAGLPPGIVVDASHANSGYDPERQPFVAEKIGRQRLEGDKSLLGVMIESNLVGGKQSISKEMVYGKSVTDACLGWDETEALLARLHAMF